MEVQTVEAIVCILDKTDKGHTWTQVINSAQGDTEVKKRSEVEVDVK